MNDLDLILEYLAVELLRWESEVSHFIIERRGLSDYCVPKNYLLTGNGMLEVIEAMYAKGWDMEIYPDGVAKRRIVLIRDVNGISISHEGSSLPEAVARVAYKALTHDE